MGSRAATTLQQQVDSVAYWHHTMNLGDGVVTPGGGGDSQSALRRIELPGDLTGKTVLDIGAWDGFYSFECERRGAARVVASDLYVWRQAGWDGKAGFELARRALGSSVEDREIDVFDISPETVGMFDVVLFLGVLYHLRDPLGGLARAASVTRELLIVETHVDFLDQERPALAFYPGAELAGDATNWFGPNVPALVGMLESLDFDEVNVVSVEPSVGDEDWLRITGDGHRTQGTRRAVVHARRRSPASRHLPHGHPATEGTKGPEPDADERPTPKLHRARRPKAEATGKSDHSGEATTSIREDQYEAAFRENRALRERVDALAVEVIELRRQTEAGENPELVELRDRAATVENELAAARRQIGVLENMKVVRWTVWPRRIVYRWRTRKR